MEIDAQYRRLADQGTSAGIVDTLPGELFVPAKEMTLNGAGICCPETPDWVVCYGEKAIAVQFQRSLQFCPAYVR